MRKAFVGVMVLSSLALQLAAGSAGAVPRVVVTEEFTQVG